MIQAMTSGHAGSMSTLHADTALDALNRLETLALMSKIDLPLYALRSQIASAINLVVQVARFPDGSRGLTEISEVLPLDADGHYQERRMVEYRRGFLPVDIGPQNRYNMDKLTGLVMHTMANILARLHGDVSGQATVEYTLLIAAFGIPLIAMFAVLLDTVAEHYAKVVFLETLPFP